MRGYVASQSRLTPDLTKNPRNIRQYALIRKPHHAPAERLHLPLPQVIVQMRIVLTVHPAVQLNDQTQRLTGEVREITSNRVLPSELQSVETSTAQGFHSASSARV